MTIIERLLAEAPAGHRGMLLEMSIFSELAEPAVHGHAGALHVLSLLLLSPLLTWAGAKEGNQLAHCVDVDIEAHLEKGLLSSSWLVEELDPVITEVGSDVTPGLLAWRRPCSFMSLGCFVHWM